MRAIHALVALGVLAQLGACSAPAQRVAAAGAPCTAPLSGVRERAHTGTLMYVVSEDFLGAHPSITPTSNFETLAEYNTDAAGCRR
ncbi:hypothetical protein GT347_19265 [Xylophilus rhododendri]|uniref:Lipoprotein n=1 Tax=Xylophilus rhododendri TaxID=2697032 RepID=A0A857J9X7_9BURK|nr:hypothetical protein [Xylophilus rhododendri]QHI99931.1 hypothetical protein GT347_19265 [Xylophilus rhododendri]